MTFEPLEYAFSTITLWHILFGFLLLAINAPRIVNFSCLKTYASKRLPTLVAAYLLLAPVVGQIAGDRYRFEQVWPTALLWGFLFATAFYAVTSYKDSKALKGRPVMIVGWLVHGLFVSAIAVGLIYVLPWIEDSLWLLHTPRQPWGVID